jgi:hypothetical protein
MRFLRDMQNALWMGLSLYRGPVGESGGSSFAGTFERQESIFGFLFGPGGH